MILTLVTLCGLFMALAYAVAYSRATNLDILNGELCAALSDATRNAAYWQARTDALLCENSTLAVDLEHSERHAAYCRSHRQRRRDLAAGFILVTGLAREGQKMHVCKEVAP